MLQTRSCLIVLMSALPLSAQETDAEVAERMFRERFVTAVRGLHAGLPSYERVLEGLAEAEIVIPELSEDKRGAAQLGIDVRRAEVRMLQGRDADAAAQVEAARDAARSAGAWEKSPRELANVILWQVAPLVFARLWPEEETFVRDAEVAAADALEAADANDPRAVQRAFGRWVPLVTLRAGRDLQDPARAPQAERELRDLAAMPRLEASTALRGWRNKALQVLAWHFLMQRDDARARVYLEQLPEDLTRYPRALIALRQKAWPTALRLGRQLADSDPRYEQLVGHALELRGLANASREDLNAAREAYRAALDVEDLATIDRVVVRRGLGDVALWLSEFDAAELERARSEYEAALRLCVESAGAPDTADWLHVAAERVQIEAALAHVLEREGSLAAAFERYREAIGDAGRLRQRLARRVFGGTLLKTDDFDAVAGAIRTHKAAGISFRDLLMLVDGSKGYSLREWMDDPASRSSRDREASKRMAVAVHELALSRPADFRERAAALESARVELEQSLAATPPERGRWPFKVPDDALTLSYWSGTASVGGGMWLLWADGEEHGVLRLEKDLEAAFAAAAAVARPNGDPTEALEAAARRYLPQSLHARILAAPRIVFCPDDVLGVLPIEALPIGGVALGVRKPVERTPSLAIRQRLRQRSHAGTGVAIVHSIPSDPALDAAFGLDPLAFSAREAELVARAYDTSRELRAEAASSDALRDLLVDEVFDVVHVSSHAVFDPKVPTSTLLLLADAATSIESLLDVPLNGALLVLSACSSATGELRGGEGEVGLLGWPFAANARGVVAAQWPVNQQATMDLMGQFHAIRASGVDDAEAMRQAREILANADNYRHPHYWAGFGVYAPPTHTSGSAPGYNPWWVRGAILASLLMALVFGAKRRVHSRRRKPRATSRADAPSGAPRASRTSSDSS